MKDKNKILISIQQCQRDDYEYWAYSVSIGDGIHKIGNAESYESAARLAKSGVKSATKYINSLTV